MKAGETIKAIGSVILAIPHSYASILFSDSVLLGLMLLLVTLLSPIVGVSGLISLIFAILMSRLLGFESWESRSGIAAFNSLLTGMTLGYYFPLLMISRAPMYYLGFLCLVSMATLLLYILLSHISYTYFRMPAMSMPFTIVALLLWFYFARTGYLSNYPFDKLQLICCEPSLPEFWRLFFVSLGSIFFTPEVIAGIMVAIALLIITRIGFLLAVLGWGISYLLMHFSGLNVVGGMFYPGFNGILIMLAIGGIFLLPGKSSWLVGALATSLGFFITLLLNITYHHYNSFTGLYTPLRMPVFALPLNLVIPLMIFSLRLRIKTGKPILNDLGIFNPEHALQVYQERYKRFYNLGIPQFSLPLQGQWLITQGHKGEHTHKLDWAYAWDFEMQDKDGLRYAGTETQLSDYLTFGKPVFASAAGTVAAILEGIPDNPIGQINTRENWGNYVCINHGYGLYSFYAHLKKGSINVKPGDYLKQGDRLGQVGNSGRSPLPHLHFQIQLGAEPGSKTRLSHLVSYKLHHTDGSLEFVSSDVPRQGEQISALVPELHLQNMLGLQNLSEQQLAVRRGKKETLETWKVNLDLWGNWHIFSDRGSELGFSVYAGIYNALSFGGKRNTALAAFARLISRLPYAEKQILRLEDEPALSIITHPAIRHLLLLITPLFSIFGATTQSSVADEKTTITVQSTTRYRLLGIPLQEESGKVVINKYEGLAELSLYRNGRTVLRAERKPQGET